MGFAVVVQKGDTLSGIARRFGHENWRAIYDHVSNAAFRRACPNPQHIEPGTCLYIPDLDGNDVQPTDVLRVCRSHQQGRNTNTIRIAIQPLFLAIKRMESYEGYGWKPSRRDQDYGKIDQGLFRGDPAAAKAFTDGYVYVLRKADEDGFRMEHVFRVDDQASYQELTVSQGNEIDYDAPRGAARSYMRIRNHFPGPLGVPPETWVIASDIRLSDQRLFHAENALTKDPSYRGTWLQLGKDRMMEVPTTPASGPDLDRNLEQTGTADADYSAYHLQRTVFDGKPGWYLFVPDAFAEARRRNSVYVDRLRRYYEWRDAPRRSKESFIHRTIRAILKKEPRYAGKVDQDRMDAWASRNSREFRSHFFPVHYAVEDLLAWLRDPTFLETLCDYNQSDDDEQLQAAAAYEDGIAGLHHTQQGASYLESEYDDPESFFNRASGWRELQGSPEEKVPTVRGDHEVSGRWSGSFAVIRKWNHVAFGFMTEFVPIILAKEKGGFVLDIHRFLRRTTGAAAKAVKIKPVKHLDMWVEQLDVEDILRKVARAPSTRVGKGLVAFVETVNVVLAVWGLAEAKGAAEKTKASLNLVDAAMTLAATRWLTDQSRGALAHLELPGRVVPYVPILSGIIDCVLGIWETKEELETGDLDAAVGWGVFTLGGAVMIAGYALKHAGTTVIVGTAGTGVEIGGPLVVLGLIVEGVGLLVVALCNDNEIEEWLARCMFGAEHLILSKPTFNSLDEEIAALNEIMCKFEVEADFQDFDRRSRGCTRVTFKIEPRLISKGAIIRITDIAAIASARIVEFFFGSTNDLEMGAAGTGDIEIHVGTSGGWQVIEKDGRIEEIRTSVWYDMDIDEVSGRASLEMAGERLQGLSVDFRCQA